MAFDPTYNTQVYTDQGGAHQMIGPTGTLEVLGKITGLGHGNIIYVDSVNGSDTNDGLSWAKAVATLTKASTLCTADNGDLILLAPNHAETIVAAAGVALAKAGVSVIGVGVGRQRAKFTFTTLVSASFDITAARVSVQNIVLVCAIDAQTAMMNISVADVVVRNCELQTGDATYQALLGILTTASADRLRIEDNHFHGTVDAGTTSQIQLVGGDSIVIRNNVLIGACALTGNIKSLTTASTNLAIIGNFLLNQTADAHNTLINLKSDATGLIANNRGATVDTGTATPIVAAGAYVAGNYFSKAAGTTASTLV